MFHKDRRYDVKCCSSVEELVAEIKEGRKNLSHAWELEGFLFLNDSFNEGGIFDVSVLHIKNRINDQVSCDQLESITLDLYDVDGLREYIKLAMKSDVLAYGEEIVVTRTPWVHSSCV